MPRNFRTIERFVEPCILLLLYRGRSHGYGLMENLGKQCGEKVDIGNLYRTLRKMETNGLITSSWENNKVGPKRRIYTVTQKGIELLKTAASSLIQTEKLIHHFLEGYQKNIRSY